jgi:hypothetical protein
MWLSRDVAVDPCVDGDVRSHRIQLGVININPDQSDDSPSTRKCRRVSAATARAVCVRGEGTGARCAWKMVQPRRRRISSRIFSRKASLRAGLSFSSILKRSKMLKFSRIGYRSLAIANMRRSSPAGPLGPLTSHLRIVSGPLPGARPHSLAMSAADRLLPIARPRSSRSCFSSEPVTGLILRVA